MKSKLILVGLIFISSTLYSQKAGRVITLHNYAGYENNLLKAPSTFLTDTSEEVLERYDLWSNASYAGIAPRFITWTKGKKHLLDINGELQNAFLPNDSEIEARKWEVAGVYHYKKSAKSKNKLSFGYRDYIRTGNNNDNLIGVPLSYRRWFISEQFDQRIGKRSSLFSKVYSQNKYYSMHGYESFFYTDNGLNLAFQRNFMFKKKIGWELFTGFHQRNYFLKKTDKSTKRIWRYYDLRGRIKYPVSKHLKLIGSLGYTYRKDIIQERLGYHKMLAEISLRYKKGKWKGEVLLSNTDRRYTEFTFGPEDELLRYQYPSAEVKLNYKLSSTMSLQLNAFGKKRISNAEEEERTSLRSYTISSFQLGIVWKQKKEKAAKKNRVDSCL